MNLQDRYKNIQDGIARAAAKSRREPSAVKLVAVTKNGSPDQIKQLVEMGHRDFAESKVQQLQQPPPSSKNGSSASRTAPTKNFPPLATSAGT